MKLSKIGRVSMALAASVALGLGMTACGGGTIGFMWVVGTQSTSSQASSIAGFKVDNFTGNLTTIPRSPFSSVGTNPSNIVVRSGGRYVYVVNQGTGGRVPDGSVTSFSVGGDGVLTFQQSYGTAGGTPIWAQMDNNGAYLYVLDRLDPTNQDPDPTKRSGLGDVSVFAVAADTGRLSIVTNQQIKDPNNTQVNLGYFPVGPNPTMMRLQGNSCLMVMDQNQSSDAYNNSIFPYQVQTSGQLVTTVNGNVNVGASQLTSVTTGNGAYLYLTDVGPLDAKTAAPTTNGQIYAFSVGTGCALNAVVQSPFPNVSPAQRPVWTLTEGRNFKYLYVLNQSNTNSGQANSSISAFVIDATTGKLTQNPGANNPYPVGSGPTCMVEDPTNKWLYTSNILDGTVTGKAINLGSGELSDLQRGSKFTAVTHASCLAVSGAVS